MNQTFNDIELAYQLRHHFGSRTRYRKPLLSARKVQQKAQRLLESVCSDHQYHLLECKVEPVFVRALVSLRPEHRPSAVAQNIKGTLSRQLKLAFPDAFPTVTDGKLWADGYFSASVGRATFRVLEEYLGRQAEHHGYKSKSVEHMKYLYDVPEWDDETIPKRIRYHIVLEVQGRAQLFDREITDRLAPALRDIVAALKCKLRAATFVPDHLHLGVWGNAAVAPRDLVLQIMNESSNWMLEHYHGALKEAEAWDTWSRSAYVGTIGEVSSAHVANYLRQND